MRRRGFAYIIAVLILGLLAFMGIFVMQSSSTEYSHAASSCYATMAQQIAECAADEAFLLIENELRQDPVAGQLQGNKKRILLRQCLTSDYPFNGGQSGLDPTLFGFPDLKDYVVQSKQLISSHLTRAGFKIEKIAVLLTDCRPIPHLPFGHPDYMYLPRDRTKHFDDPDPAQLPDQYKLGRDYYLTLTMRVEVSVVLGGRTSRFTHECSRDMKVLNVGPIGKAYTLFSAMGPEYKPGTDDEAKYDLSRGNGRLILWNHPFQSRLYLHGPAVIGIENPDLNNPQDKTNNWQGGYVLSDPEGKPGFNQAFQYSSTYCGTSYIPYPQRGLIENPRIRPGSTNFINDVRDETEKKLFEHNTYKKGRLPRPNAAWSELADFLHLGTDYIRGTVGKQVFLPAGPFCRFPWRFVSYRYQPRWANLKNQPELWPVDDKNLRIEHRYLTDDNGAMEKDTKILAALRQFRLWRFGAFAGLDNSPGLPKLFYNEFSLMYGNSPDAESWWDAPGIFASNLWNAFWTQITLPGSLIFKGLETAWRYIRNPSDPTAPTAIFDTNMKNFYPSNFKFFQKATVLMLKNVDEIPKETIGGKEVWILDGVYLLRSFETNKTVYYKGRGMIYVGEYVENKPFTIGGSIMPYRENPGDPNEDDEVKNGTSSPNHLTLAYHPTTADGKLPPDLSKAYIHIKGKGNVIKASIYSLAGIRTDDGILTDADFQNYGFDPSLPTRDWPAPNLSELAIRSNMIVGNYVNLFMKKANINGDLWVIHDTKNRFFFRLGADGSKQLCEDYDEGEQVMAHTVHLSPKIQHLTFYGTTQ